MKKIGRLKLFLFLLGLLHGFLLEAQTDSLFEVYLQEREVLLQRDSQLYFDHAVLLGPKEEALNRKMQKWQQELLQQYKEQHFFPPARNFYQSKKHIENNPLFELLRKMPKGGILHLHSSAMGDPDWMIQRAIATPEMYVYWGKTGRKYVKGQLRAFPEEQVPEGFQQVRRLHKKEKGFYGELRELLTFERAMDRDSVDIWKEFQAIFQRISGFVKYDKIFVDYITDGLKILVADNIQHAELRMPYRNFLYSLDQPADPGDLPRLIAALQQIEQNIKAIDPDFTFNIIHTNLRFRDSDSIWADMQQIYQNKIKHPRWLKGYDLVAEEDAGHPTLFHVKNFLQLDSLEKAHGIPLPLYLHDGESCWASVDNLYDAVLLGSKRIGHGFNLFRFPHLMEQVKTQQICLEISPLSNQILGYIRDLRLHPGSTYLRRGLACSISSDDPLIFDYHGLTYDYWSIYLAWELDLAALKQLSKNGLLHAAMTEEERKRALALWEKKWEHFIDNN